MKPTLRTGLSPFLLLAGALILLTGSGCVPNVSWLPDSSGFVHSGREHRQLVHYDLATGKHRVFVENTGATTPWPAVSPDGKRVATASYVPGKDAADTLEVLIYDFQGKLVQRSTTFRWGEPSAGSRGDRTDAFLCWSPRSEHVVVWAGDHTGIYDVRNDGLIVLDDTYPCAIAANPVRPEGDGFLISRGITSSQLRYTFVNWEGREYDIAMTPLDAIQEREWLKFPFAYQSRWEGDVAVMKYAKECVQIDTKRRTCTLQTDAPREVPAGEVMQQVVFTNRAVLRVLQLKDGNDQSNTLYYRLEYFDEVKREPRILVERSDCCLVFPAPNGRMAAVRCTPENKGHHVLVFNEKGERVAEVRMD